MPAAEPPRDRYPVTGAHCRAGSGTTVYSVRSPDPQVIIRWMAEFIGRHTGFEVTLDHQYPAEPGGG